MLRLLIRAIVVWWHDAARARVVELLPGAAGALMVLWNLHILEGVGKKLFVPHLILRSEKVSLR